MGNKTTGHSRLKELTHCDAENYKKMCCDAAYGRSNKYTSQWEYSFVCSGIRLTSKTPSCSELWGYKSTILSSRPLELHNAIITGDGEAATSSFQHPLWSERPQQRWSLAPPGILENPSKIHLEEPPTICGPHQKGPRCCSSPSRRA